MAAPEAKGSGRPRILVTGFSAFPGAPVNPTETLMGALGAVPKRLAALGKVRTEVLDVAYDSVPARLKILGAEFAPDIAIHFGLSREASGFTLERLARNAIAPGMPDSAGHQPEASRIVEQGADLLSGLPLERIAESLAARGLAASWSNDAGAYLCNYLFYLSRGHLCTGFSPAMAGFIHVPPLDEGADAPANAMPLDDLVAGALAIIETCAGAWHPPARV